MSLEAMSVSSILGETGIFPTPKEKENPFVSLVVKEEGGNKSSVPLGGEGKTRRRDTCKPSPPTPTSPF